MNETAKGENKARRLRKKAEERLIRSRQDVAGMTPDDVQELVYNLQVHQIELEMQNEALGQAHAETEAALQKFADLYDRAPVGYLTIDRDDLIVQANLMTAALLGQPRQQLVGQKITRFLTPESQDIFYIHKGATLRSDEVQSCHIEIVSETPLFLHVNSQRAEGQADSFNTTLSDITLMKKLEARLTQLHQAAETANTAKTQFLANMSHEIRTPLNAVIGIGHLLTRTKLDAKQTELVKVMNDGAKSLHAVVDELLDFSKIESGAIELECRPFDLKALLGDITSMLETSARDKQIRLWLDYDAGLPAEFIGDAHRLRQIVVNLVSNAIKFTEAGRVNIRVSGTRPAPDMVDLDIAVIDTGIGIPKDKLSTIFDKFTQADASTTRRFGGTGLGLSIARQLVEKMGGDIVVRSEVDAGSTFRVHLPLSVVVAEETAAGGTTENARGDARKLPRVLIVDDYSPNVMVITTYLEQLGFDCDVCTDGRQAVDRFDQHPYQVIFMDIQMPVMDGLAATTEIRRLEKERGLGHRPIIGVSAHVQPADRQQCIDAGMDGYIPKPFLPEDIKAQLSRFAVS